MKKPSLTNYMLDREDAHHYWIDGSWRDDSRVLLEMERIKGPSKVSEAAKRQQEYLKHYFNSVVGSVSWQEDMV